MTRLQLLGEVLNDTAEWHGLVIGAACGLLAAATGNVGLAVALWATLTGGRRLKGHLADARTELAYTIAGAALAYTVAHLTL